MVLNSVRYRIVGNQVFVSLESLKKIAEEQNMKRTLTMLTRIENSIEKAIHKKQKQN